MKSELNHDVDWGDGPVRTDMNCTNCSKNFIAELDHSIDGNHIVECPHCGHEHCRVIKDGVISGERWDSKTQRVDVDKRCVWKHNALAMQTSTASAFIRRSWLNFGLE